MTRWNVSTSGALVKILTGSLAQLGISFGTKETSWPIVKIVTKESLCKVLRRWLLGGEMIDVG